MAIARNQVNELLYQALETEIGGVQVYQAALRCAVNNDLKKESSAARCRAANPLLV